LDVNIYLEDEKRVGRVEESKWTKKKRPESLLGLEV